MEECVQVSMPCRAGSIKGNLEGCYRCDGGTAKQPSSKSLQKIQVLGLKMMINR